MIIILLLIIGFLLFNNFSTQNSTVKIGDAVFTLPNGYKEDGVNEYGALTITNGTNSIYLVEHNDKDISKHVSEYENVTNYKNETMRIENFTMNNTLFYKTNNVDNPNTVHIWFVKNNNTYDIYKFDKNSKFQDSVMYLYNHMA